MKIRLLHTNRKQYKTQTAYDSNGFPFLYWEVFPEHLDLKNQENIEGVRVWLAGTSMSEKWFIREKHEKGSPMFPLGGYTVTGILEVARVLPEEVILHPSVKTKKSKKKKTE